jgi:hypothetical protein
LYPAQHVIYLPSIKYSGPYESADCPKLFVYLLHVRDHGQLFFIPTPKAAYSIVPSR